MDVERFVYKIPYRRARAWPSARASKGILHTIERSELLLEPCIMIPKELIELLFINFCINPFHIQEA